jgi:tetratricopeptide (TPR) repeat protein
VDDIQNSTPENTSGQNVCISCGSPEILQGFRNKLCAPCRTKFIKFPIPLWVKLFGAGIAAIMLISIIWLPRNLSAAIALSRAEKAEQNRDYVSEQHELETARNVAPGSIDVLSHLMIASFYNNDFRTVISVSGGLQNKTFDDTVLFNKLNYVMIRVKECFPSDTFTKYFDEYKKSVIPDTAYRRYISKNPMDIYALYSLASNYSDENKNTQADTMIGKALNIDHDFMLGLILKSIVKRDLNQADSSIYYCDKILGVNRQSTFALSSKARTLLKTGKKQEGMQVALQCAELDKTMPYNLATLAIAYHLTKDFKKRDAIIKLAEKDSSGKVYMQYAKDVISNKVKFQN